LRVACFYKIKKKKATEPGKRGEKRKRKKLTKTTNKTKEAPFKEKKVLQSLKFKENTHKTCFRGVLCFKRYLIN
jgi:hypothetical protein